MIFGDLRNTSDDRRHVLEFMVPTSETIPIITEFPFFFPASCFLKFAFLSANQSALFFHVCYYESYFYVIGRI